MYYITFEEYKALGGVVEASAFSTLCRKANRLLDMWTLDRCKHLTTIPSEVKECLTEMINTMSGWEYGNDVTSFSNGKVSIAFDTKNTREQSLYNDIALVYLPVSLISGVIEQ